MSYDFRIGVRGANLHDSEWLEEHVNVDSQRNPLLDSFIIELKQHLIDIGVFIECDDYGDIAEVYLKGDAEALERAIIAVKNVARNHRKIAILDLQTDEILDF